MDLREQVIAEIRKIYDPEIPVNIYELGLIYDVKVKEDKAKIIMKKQLKLILILEMCTGIYTQQLQALMRL